MEHLIQGLVSQPLFKTILKEWSLHVKTDQDPTTFANIYMEWMRDPVDHVGRLVASQFLNFIRARDWSDTMRVIEPKLDLDVAVIFRSEAAMDFYRGWRDMVVQQVQDYWEQFLAVRREKGLEIGPRDWSPRAGYCVCKGLPWECVCKKPLP